MKTVICGCVCVCQEAIRVLNLAKNLRGIESTVKRNKNLITTTLKVRLHMILSALRPPQPHCCFRNVNGQCRLFSWCRQDLRGKIKAQRAKMANPPKDAKIEDLLVTMEGLLEKLDTIQSGTWDNIQLKAIQVFTLFP